MSDHLCHNCGGAIVLLGTPEPDRECPHCGRLLHVCDNCQFFDVSGCVMEIPHPYLATHGTLCDQFQFRALTGHALAA